jgi:hypothetical protein
VELHLQAVVEVVAQREVPLADMLQAHNQAALHPLLAPPLLMAELAQNIHGKDPILKLLVAPGLIHPQRLAGKKLERKQGRRRKSAAGRKKLKRGERKQRKNVRSSGRKKLERRNSGKEKRSEKRSRRKRKKKKGKRERKRREKEWRKKGWRKKGRRLQVSQ